ncbi:MAG: hypothetical protein RJA57_958 [Bacteroidota bacterium]
MPCRISGNLAHMSDRLPKNWEQQAAARQKMYRGFLRRVDRNRVLRLLPELHDAATREIDCLQCANCCRNYSPRFKTTDIRRISKALRLRESELIERYLTVDSDGDFVANRLPCPFLGSDNRCSIYEDRPSDCRRFPYTDEDVLVKRPAITLKNVTFCPITFQVLERLLHEVS